jgi:hypothetical protein
MEGASAWEDEDNRTMGQMIESDSRGTLVVPAGVVPPLTRFSVEPHGDVVILRREPARADEWWASTTPEQRAAWFREWVSNLPPSVAVPLEATRREALYD